MSGYDRIEAQIAEGQERARTLQIALIRKMVRCRLAPDDPQLRKARAVLAELREVAQTFQQIAEHCFGDEGEDRQRLTWH
jgi:hypothetical protein